MIPDFAIRTLRLQKIVNDEAESRLVYHYQFLAWPDHGVRPNPGTAVNVLEEINQLQPHMTDKLLELVEQELLLLLTSSCVSFANTVCNARLTFDALCRCFDHNDQEWCRQKLSTSLYTCRCIITSTRSQNCFMSTNVLKTLDMSIQTFATVQKPLPTSMSCSWFVQSRFVSFSCFMHTRFKWYNIRRPAIDPKQADPTYYENLALSVPLAQGYIDRLGEIWFEMVSVSRDHDSTHWLPHVDIKQPKAEYESVKALETAPDSVKKLFSIEFGRRKDLTFQWKRALMNKVRQNELDTSSLEVRIAKHTALIRHWSKLLSEMKSGEDIFFQQQ
ncbi:28S ribosomal protein S15, mitochondrial [Trichinella murrelli]|uniref:Small ribosomal subunit protein uS15m n=1 Tax=Trichinella murrelli TaxID=144512 RepID=A0A0V0UBK6_9BILA|nr:28S ribosomal protein S15, mitochondrial [Trichinella murrelli]